MQGSWRNWLLHQSLFLSKMAEKHGSTAVSSRSKNSKESTQSNSSLSIQPSTDPPLCPVCCEVILDDNGQAIGHDCIHCDEACQTWIHRQCAGLSKAAFMSLSDIPDSFYCPRCVIRKQDSNITDLRSFIEKLVVDVWVFSSSLIPHICFHWWFISTEFSNSAAFP